ncbi:peptidase M15 [Xylanimonas allomyrinae]|uniref:Peptidase M15 n=1 Tax=Xylanimonas allomyrinae TaxID=2509459 RepID=A0A4P6ERJ2_9MICO|nr:D-alanyl-D-alanine carboxypeptidase family protein [Xylanimonas allomyrinae]QAY64533.1 peptidase M15 [Xylanimonas allomyrinae]
MSTREHARRPARRPRWALLVAGVAGAVLAGAFAYHAVVTPPLAAASAEAASSAAAVAPDAVASGPPDAVASGPPDATGDAPAASAPGRDRRPALGETGGTGGLSVLDDGEATVTRLHPALLTALRAAATDAAGDDVTITVTSGWRSAEQQEQLLHQAITQYGSAAAAARWVATPQTSAHVSGDAVDVAGAGATAWLTRHGAAYGLCQIYANESWHYELRPQAAVNGCPAMYADPTQDPRMQQ